MNKKGLTLVELIACISIISIVVVLLFQLIINLQQSQNGKEEISGNNLTIAMITREVQKDIESFGLAEEPTTTCNLTSYSTDRNQILPTSVLSSINPYYCVKLVYNQDDVKYNEGYILYYQNKGKGFLAYKRGKGNIMETQIVREITKIPVANRPTTISNILNTSSNISSLKIDMPIGNANDNYKLAVRYFDTSDMKFGEHFVTISASYGTTNLSGAGKYKPGDTVTISFDYNTNRYTLSSVTCTNVSCPKTNNFTFTMPNNDVSISIMLSAGQKYNLTLNPNISNAISSSSGVGSYYAGEQVTVTFNYDTSKYKLTSVTCPSGITCSNSNTLSFTMPNNNVQIDVNFSSVTNLKDYIASLDKSSNGLKEDTTADKNLRYVGATPKNYIKFNNETWRIIGIVDGYVKIIRQDRITDASGNNTIAWASTNVNNWTTSSLKTYLNGNYYDSLSDIAKSQIQSRTWNLGGWNTSELSAENMYNYERGTTVSSGRPTEWPNGNIALMYPSDYGYASKTEACTNNLYDCDNSTAKANNWLYISQGTSHYNEWTLSPNSSYSYRAFYVDSSGYVSGYSNVNNSLAVRPVLYLKSNISRESGDGSSSNPYIIE